MAQKDNHLTDEEFLMAADGELPPRLADRAHRHLLACWDCRTRMGELEAVIAEFVHLRHGQLDARIPPPEGPRRLLAARMAQPARPGWRQGWRAAFGAKRLACISITVLAAGFLGYASWRLAGRSAFVRGPVLISKGPIPDYRLTPGAARILQADDVCASGERPIAAPHELEQRVFEEYGIRGTPTEAYEVDFLITPELGGTADIRNLWPEPYKATVWNAHVKDQLEDRLRQLVCERKVDLPTAQHDIATDWIAAYKKYFQTDKPIQVYGNS